MSERNIVQRFRNGLLLGVVILLTFRMLTQPVDAAEAIIGKTTIEPGIAVVFEGAVRDKVWPPEQHLAEMQTDVHLEARVNWSTDQSVDVPRGAPRGGFVPYMHIGAEVTNERTGAQQLVTLTPHLNLLDNFHYARNVNLPGKKNDTFTITFFLNPPDKFEMAFHRDWKQSYGTTLFQADTLTYREVNFSNIVDLTR